MKVLLHTCCAPCLIYPLKALEEEGYEIMSFFYNPNIQPYEEYEKRLSCLNEFAQTKGAEITQGYYDIDRFFQDVVFNGRVRCSRCYTLRLTETAKFARRNNYDAYSTTLLASPLQAVNIIEKIGKVLGEKYHIDFLDRNFRKGWNESVIASKELGLYRQNYCGCIYSQRDRSLPQRYTNR